MSTPSRTAVWPSLVYRDADSARPESGVGGLPPGVGAVYVAVSDPDRLYARATSNGATITREMRDEEYGSRGFQARDPEGVLWSFGTYAGADSEGG
ncbi:MAG TPA: VOC family protein [Candidatus Acidoferrales bacterium]|nr:VOC family protein [Candidatus Acidoferrales bacterium]